MLRNFCFLVPVMAILAAAIHSTGCGRSEDQPPTLAVGAPADNGSDPPSVAVKPDEEHAHQPGARGGIIVSIGRDSFHAEAVFETGGTLRLYMLGKDEAKIHEVDSQTLKAFAKAAGSEQSTAFSLKPEPQDDDAPGKTSQFVGELPADLQGQSLEVTIPSIRIAGERYRLGFSSASESHGDEAMPNKVADEEEQKLYLTAAGKYSDADIAANGNMTASQKFRGFKPAHDLFPKAGDVICPITLTKANPKCSWIIGGKNYEFCCPPCVDEFVKLAKEKPDEVKETDEYVKK